MSEKNLIYIKRNSLMDKVRYFLNLPTRLFIAAYASLVAGMAAMTPTLCAQTGVAMDALFDKMVDIVCQIAFYVGAIIIVGGIFNWVLAQKDENADGQSRAIKFIVCGFALVGLKILVQPILAML